MSQSTRTAADIAADKKRLAEEEAALSAPLIADVAKTLNGKAFSNALESCRQAHDGLLGSPVKLHLSSWLTVTEHLQNAVIRATEAAEKG